MHAPTKIAIIGIGRWGKNLLREFSLLPQCEIVSVFYQGNQDTSTWLKENYPNLKTASSLEEIEKDISIEAVVIATPIATHFEIARRMLMSGKHVFVEKPLCETGTQGLELVEISNASKKILFVGYTFIYNQVFGELNKILLEKKAPIKSLFFSWTKWGSFQESLVANLLCHDIAISASLLGDISEPERIFSQAGISKEDIAEFSFKGKNNEKVVSYINRLSREKRKSITVQTESSIYIWENDSLFEVQEGIPGEIFTASKSQLELECGAFISSVQNSEVVLTDGDFGAKVSKILEEITPLE